MDVTNSANCFLTLKTKIMFKKCRVILLPIKEKAENCVLISDKTGGAHYPGKKYFTKAYLKSQWWAGHDMYILSDDKPESGDFVYVNHYSNVWEYRNSPCSLPYWGDLEKCEKIIASTRPDIPSCRFISDGFIQKFVDELNKGNRITEVMVEYQEDWNPETVVCMEGNGDNPDNFPFVTKPKVNSKDNTITIRKIKTEWTRAEVEDLIYKAMKDVGYTSVEDFQHFCKENL